jgi:probable HAF family extracellular repeat protein
MLNRLLQKFLLGLVGALMIALAISFTAATATTSFYYDVTDLGTLPGDTGSTAYSINEAGQIVGSSYNTTTGAGHVFLWQSGNMAPLLNLGTKNSIAWSINNKSQIVGEFTTSTGSRHAFLWQNDTLSDLGTLAGYTNSIAYSINERGQVTGYAYNGIGNGSRQAFLWQQNSGMKKLKSLSSNDSLAYGINNRGQVVGGSRISTEAAHIVLWQNYKINDLGTFNGKSSSGHNINNRGQIVGSSTDINTERCFWLQNSTIKDLGTIMGYNRTRPIDINDAGTIVGFSFNGYNIPDGHAFVGNKIRIRDLNSLLPANSGWVLNVALGINNNGQIVGGGTLNGQRRAFLLTPVRVTS